MILRFLILLLAMMSFGCSTQLKKPFIWSLERDSKTSYLLGTQHQGVPFEDLPDWVLKKIDDANVVVLEAELRKIEDKEATDFSILMYRRGKELPAEKYFTKDEWSKIDELFQARLEEIDNERKKIILKNRENLTPYFYESFLYGKEKIVVEDKYTFHRLDPQKSMDLNIGRRAKNLKKKLESLDLPDFVEAHRQCQIQMAAVGIKKRLRGDVMADIEDMAVLEPYTSGEENQINAFLDASPFVEPDIRGCFLDERNMAWVPKMINLHKKEAPAFFAVGLAHISYGEKNLKNLLSKHGFKVTRIEPPK